MSRSVSDQPRSKSEGLSLMWKWTKITPLLAKVNVWMLPIPLPFTKEYCLAIVWKKYEGKK